jgi:hypothetical protein
MAQYDQLFSFLATHLTGNMPCPEYDRLRQHYEAALRRWQHVLLSLDAQPLGTAATQTAGIKQKAFDERNAAKERLSAHVLACSFCNPKIDNINKGAERNRL